MSRGPRPLKAKEEALPIAEKRGLVMRYQHRRGNIGDFSIISPGLVGFICVMRLIRLSSTPEDLIRDRPAPLHRIVPGHLARALAPFAPGRVAVLPDSR